jgi:regulator of cell morphogenesis and NO signaling
MTTNTSISDAEQVAIHEANETWGEAPLDDLIVHIVANFHEPLRSELPRLEALSRKVLAAHGAEDPRLAELNATLAGLKAELEDHMGKEEQILFPMILRGQGWMADGPIAVMHDEHDSATAALARLRELTGDYQIDADACGTRKDLWRGLAALEDGLHLHIHLENNILFPRATADTVSVN